MTSLSLPLPIRLLKKPSLPHATTTKRPKAQRCLKIRIELQGKYLEKIVEEHQDSKYSNCKSDWPLPTALPSLMELSKSHSTKCGSDSEDISQSIHRIPYHQERLFFGNFERQIAAVLIGFSYDESQDSSMSNSTPTVSHPFKRSRVGKDVLQPSLRSSSVKIRN